MAFSEVRPLLPDIKTAVWMTLTGLASLIAQAYRNRRIGIYWTAHFQRVTPGIGSPGPQDFKILLGQTQCVNLQNCQITLENESSGDAEDFDVLVNFDPPFLVVEAQAALDTSRKALLVSQEFQATLKIVKELPAEKRAAHPSFLYILHNREFRFPALNRGETASMNFWIHADTSDAVPLVRVTSEKKGIKVISRPARIHSMNVSRIRNGLLLGIALTFPAALTLSFLQMHPSALAALSFIAGAAAGIMGLLVLRFLRFVKTHS